MLPIWWGFPVNWGDACVSLSAKPYPCNVGGMAGGFFATSVGNGHPLGVEGWRFAFFLIASVSVFTGILTLVIASDPRRVRPTLLHLGLSDVQPHCIAPQVTLMYEVCFLVPLQSCRGALLLYRPWLLPKPNPDARAVLCLQAPNVTTQRIVSRQHPWSCYP